MEDHLKNKDRLDQEWEALEAYEAEPNATHVAMETANMRKNRYSDLLPCESGFCYLRDVFSIYFFFYLYFSICDYKNKKSNKKLNSMLRLFGRYTVVKFVLLSYHHNL